MGAIYDHSSSRVDVLKNKLENAIREMPVLEEQTFSGTGTDEFPSKPVDLTFVDRDSQ